MRLAHLSDLHVSDFSGARWSEFLNKRLTGLANLGTLRRHAHPIERFDALMAAVRALAPDHVAITGDLTNLSLDGEFARARDGIRQLGDPRAVSIVPGNHDVYIESAQQERSFERWFAEWMRPSVPASGDRPGGVVGPRPTEPPPDAPFPTVKVHGQVTIFGLCSAHPTPALLSYGSVDATQRARLVDLARSAAHRDHYKVALVHHNVHRRRRALKDWQSSMRGHEALLDALFEAEVGLLLHGHTHVAHRYAIRRGDAVLRVVGCGSSTWALPTHPARFNVYEIEGRELRGIVCHPWLEERGGFDLEGQRIARPEPD